MNRRANRKSMSAGSWALLLGGGGVAIFHLALLAQRLRTDAIANPMVALKWVSAFALVGIAWLLHRRGVAVGRGRTALVLTLLALLLHVGGATPPLTVPGGEDLLAALPLGLAAIASVVIVVWRSGRLRPTSPRPRRFVFAPPVATPIALDPRSALFVPRPPPVR
jgi:hypothetical protein